MVQHGHGSNHVEEQAPLLPSLLSSEAGHQNSTRAETEDQRADGGVENRVGSSRQALRGELGHSEETDNTADSDASL